MGYTIPPFLLPRRGPASHPSPNRLAGRQEPLQAPLPWSAFELTERERRMIVGALDLACLLADGTGRDAAAHRALMARLSPDPLEADLTRPQQLAVDVMHARHGRYTTRHQADGSVVITGLLDDVERETVCVERDGTERWRR